MIQKIGKVGMSMMSPSSSSRHWPITPSIIAENQIVGGSAGGNAPPAANPQNDPNAQGPQGGSNAPQPPGKVGQGTGAAMGGNQTDRPTA